MSNSFQEALVALDGKKMNRKLNKSKYSEERIVKELTDEPRIQQILSYENIKGREEIVFLYGTDYGVVECTTVHEREYIYGFIKDPEGAYYELTKDLTLIMIDKVYEAIQNDTTANLVS